MCQGTGRPGRSTGRKAEILVVAKGRDGGVAPRRARRGSPLVLPAQDADGPRNVAKSAPSTAGLQRSRPPSRVVAGIHLEFNVSSLSPPQQAFHLQGFARCGEHSGDALGTLRAPSSRGSQACGESLEDLVASSRHLIAEGGEGDYGDESMVPMAATAETRPLRSRRLYCERPAMWTGSCTAQRLADLVSHMAVGPVLSWCCGSRPWSQLDATSLRSTRLKMSRRAVRLWHRAGET